MLTGDDRLAAQSIVLMFVIDSGNFNVDVYSIEQGT
jgi:hypothetical protein